ncbi:hypothetical protein P170DRAFT_362782 [Aspergillus steynii IBT 23096]|uniref:Uncharacterized protein n=1 Tax=Aspergillus steynii IBT 23096 TaxID=1392250 RepID=A0A2I2G2Z5_9EURO|nr:uncharacterized protein P170DRAFT_362782 [Aspergillus steynii IBT 23096]PLB47237.1 hypothetical protein P170DRAFT_362782 [Aspergillus steynii IBT 23096]
MPFWRQKPQWPPLPSVEDEVASLSREWQGLSNLGENPGVEGVCARGTVDQYPVIMDVFCYSEETLVVEEFSREPSSSSDDSAGPPTPPTDFPQFSIPQHLASKLDLNNFPFGPSPFSLPPTSQKALPPGPSPQRTTSHPGHIPQSTTSAGSRSSSRQRDPSSRSTRTRKEAIPAGPKESPPALRKGLSRVHTHNGQQSEPASSSVPRRSESVKSARPLRRSATDTQRPGSSSGYLSDSNAAKSKTKTRRDRPEPLRASTNLKTVADVPNTPTLAERLEEKLRQRQEQRDSKGTAHSDVQKPSVPLSAAKPPKPFERKIELPVQRPPSRPKTASPKPDRPRSAEQDPFSASFATVTPADQVPSSRMTTRRTVSFFEDALKPPSCHRKAEPDIVQQLQSSRSNSPQGSVRPPSPSKDGSCLLPCPRSVPVAGYQDWFTIRGMTHLNICPSCMKQMRKSKFRDAFILGTPRSRGDMIRCSMSEPWTRLAWMQTVKKQLDHLDLLQQITRTRSSGSKPCPGRIVSEQHWYRVVDPDTGLFLPKFNVCSACVKNLRTLMPPHRNTFKRSTALQARVCDFVTDSPRFVRYIDYLDIAANRSEMEWTSQPDLGDFMAYARRKVVLRDCRRDRLVLNTWHYIPQLPELTVCEDCYDDVVWPLVKANHPIARKFSTLMRLPPGEGPSRCREASCQLYSPRMRTKFRDAVQRDDLMYLKLAALRRFDAEQRFRERQEELLDDEARGYECETELRKNLEEWKAWE